MQHEWRLLVTSPDGDPKPTISIDDAVASLDAFDVDGMGNSLEATLTALPASVDLALRDVVTLEARQSGGDWIAYYRGMVTIAGNPRSAQLQQYRLVGLKQRFYEITHPLSRVPAGDVASMARASLTAATLPVGVAYDAANAPDVGFELGDRYPAFESVGETLDALARTAGAFIVPTGETYQYDGVTFTEGDLIPAVQWGVDAAGEVFFRRAVKVSTVVSEGASGVRVEWLEAQAEEVADRVRLVYAAGTNTENLTRLMRLPTPGPVGPSEDLPPVWRPLTRVFSIGQGDIDEVLGLRGTDALDADAERVVTLDNPGDLMTRIESIDRVSNVTESFWTGLENAFDGDLGTYATNNTSAIIGQSFSSDEPGKGPFSTGEAVLQLDFRVFDQGSVIRPYYALVQVNWINVGIDASAVTAQWEFGGNDNDDDRFVSILLPLLLPAATADEYPPSRRLVIVTLPANTRLYRFGLLVPDSDVGGVASKRVATTLAKLPSTAASRLTRHGLHQPTTWIRLTTRDDATIEAPIERVEYRITRDAGATTEYHVGSAFNADLEQQRIILERLARRATRDGGA